MAQQSESCLICGRALPLHQRISGGVCEDLRCRDKALRQTMEAERAAAAIAFGIADPAAHYIFPVPRYERSLSRLPVKRRQKFQRYLKRLAEAAASGPEQPEPAPVAAQVQPQEPEPFAPLPERETKLLGQACAACRGFCCQHGGDHAFLTAAEFRQRLARNPTLDPDQLAEIYAEFLPARSHRDACVYQTEIGCALPVDLRSEICNAYHCSGLKAYRTHLEQQGPQKGCALVREDNKSYRAVLFDGEAHRSHELHGTAGNKRKRI